MRKLDFHSNHNEFFTWIMWYGDFLQHVIEAKRVIKTKLEKLELIEAFVLRCAARWEVLCKEDIITSLNRDSSNYANKLGLRLRKHLSRDECRAILYGHRYIDFKSVDDLKSFGKKYLSPQLNPFEAIKPSESKLINEFLTMRNLLAHYSDFAWRSYSNLMNKKYHYNRIREPGAFLIALTKNKQYTWSVYFKAFLRASNDMIESVS